MKSYKLLILIGIVGILTPQSQARQVEYTVYSVYQGIPMGTPGEVLTKDFYVNMGSDQGIRQGNTLEVYRRVPTYDLVNDDYYRDVLFPIAHLKVIHVEEASSICRLEKLLPLENTPTIVPRAVMVGDQVKRIQ